VLHLGEKECDLHIFEGKVRVRLKHRKKVKGSVSKTKKEKMNRKR